MAKTWSNLASSEEAEAPALPRVPVLMILLLLSAFAQARLWPTVPPDFDLYLIPWYQHLVEHGPIDSFAVPFSNYSPPYLYLLSLASLTEPWLTPFDAIKLLSLAISLWLAVATLGLLRAAEVSEPARGAALVLGLPTLLLNSALLGQCDALWVAPLLLALAACLNERPRKMLVWVGIAFSIKAQAAFLAPLVFAYLLGRKSPWQWWLIPPAAYMAMLLPAWAVGWPATDLLLIYLRQGQALSSFISNAPSAWSIAAFFAPSATLPLIPAGFVIATAGCLAMTWRMRSWLVNGRSLVLAALMSALVVPFVLPKMHERYLLLADVLAFAVAIIFRTRSTLALAALVQGASLAALSSYIFGPDIWAVAATIAAAASIAWTFSLLRAERASPLLHHPQESRGPAAAAFLVGQPAN